MQSITVTAKIQISVSAADKPMLDSTLSAYCDACNYFSDYVFKTRDPKQFSLNRALYVTLREKFGLKSQMAQSVFKTVISRYKTILENQKEWMKPSFKKPQYDLVWNRTIPSHKVSFTSILLAEGLNLPVSHKAWRNTLTTTSINLAPLNLSTNTAGIFCISQ